ncbi:DUF1311 domain-containing protein [Caballeronia sp. LZ065]|uniref:lysozyme inhibitor LprI family protein n=1 Tax=Caballeronia sp. LZ065 TaxID=3038571 RepID=UPI002863A8C0|nr:lysozyme inhibitor LprI family protein [Caballeronia sp. LZ065]MDR5779431.1 DUF1311 domain-containing protein [Caballeronia sp. LZ065]
MQRKISVSTLTLTLTLTLAILSTFISSAPLAAVESEHESRLACSEFSQAGLRDCLAAKASESESKLEHAERDAAVTLSRWDEDDRYVRSAQNNLVQANRAFRHYRATQCGLIASLTGGAAGNAHDIGQLACAASLNTARADDLRNATSSLPPR